jgi:hypothetical protein
MQQGAAFFEARIGIDFDEPHLSQVINHEIVAKDLELKLPRTLNDL